MPDILSVIPAAASLLSVCVAFLAIFQARKTALTGTYFAEMAHAYSEYLRCVSEFAFRRDVSSRDAFASALYRLQLFASSEISRDAQQIYVFLIDWATSNPTGALSVDEQVNSLGAKMRTHLDQARKHGRF